jgi:signal transduction histidine kinase
MVNNNPFDGLQWNQYKRALHIQLMNEVTQIALAGAGLKEFLDQLTLKMVEILGIERCRINLWDQEKSRPIAFSCAEKGVDVAPGVAGEEHDCLTLPIRNSERKLGEILIDFPSGHLIGSNPGNFYWEEFSAVIALALSNLIAIEHERKRRREAELLQQATATITSTLDLSNVLDLILTSMEKEVPYDSAAICLIDGEQLTIAALGGSSRHTKSLGEKIGKKAGLFSLLENARQPVVLADAQNHPRYEHWSKDGKVTIQGWMGIPLIANELTIGYLVLNGNTQDVYTEDHAHLAQSFANQAAIAIEKARLFEQVRNGRERMQMLSKRLVEIQEAERRYISHELHDEIGQELTGLQFMLEMCKYGSEDDRQRAIGEAQGLVTGLMAQVRELSSNLRPSMLDDLGLLAALKAHFERSKQKMGLEVFFRQRDLERRFSTDIEVAAFRVVQESLTNVARYAEVKEVFVEVFPTDTSLNICIEDHGCGFDMDLLQDSQRSFGISGMRERTGLAGGRFEIFSKPGEGTKIKAEFPIEHVLERRKIDRQSSLG